MPKTAADDDRPPVPEVMRDNLVRLMSGLPARALTVPLDRATERRLGRHMRSLNEDGVDEPMDPHDDEDVAVALLAVAARGLDLGEADDGVWSRPDGFTRPLPRARRAPLHLRIRVACRAASREWRAN